jgi:hypothetical protein
VQSFISFTTTSGMGLCRDLFLGAKILGLEADTQPSVMPEFKNAWHFTSTIHLHEVINTKGNFTFTIIFDGD